MGGKVGKTRHKRVKVSFAAALLIVCVICGMVLGREEVGMWLCFLVAVLLHEGGHILMAWLCRVEIGGFTLDVLGARMALSGMVSYLQDFLISLGGPLANFVCATMVYGVCGKDVMMGKGYMGVFFVASVTLGIWNLLPIGTMDGGRMLTACLSAWVNPQFAYTCVKLITVVFLLGLWLLSAYALLMGAGMMSLFVFSMCLLFRMEAEGDTN